MCLCVVQCVSAVEISDCTISLEDNKVSASLITSDRPFPLHTEHGNQIPQR